MSTSSSPARGAIPDKSDHPFPYPEARREPFSESQALAPTAPFPEDLIASREQAAREAGRQEGEREAHAAASQQLAQARDSLRLALAEFAKERQAYFLKIEGEVVRLALSIARKILHREAQVDPFFLAGLVRVALEKLNSNSTVSIRVNPRDAPDCRDFLSRTLDMQQVPEVIEDSAIEAGRSILETDLGNTELGIEPQLKEVELGLMDLLAQRPSAVAKP